MRKEREMPGKNHGFRFIIHKLFSPDSLTNPSRPVHEKIRTRLHVKKAHTTLKEGK